MFQPTKNSIVIEQKKMSEEVKTESGIILEKEKKIDENPILEGTIISLGPDVTLDAKPGDIIYYMSHAAQNLSIRGNVIQIVGEPSVIGLEK